jgi:hypothetical protein
MTRISRRQFGRAIGAVTGAALLPRARADEKASASAKEADARVEVIAARYGKRLSAAEQAQLARQSKEMQAQLDKLRAFVVDEEPAHVFRAPRKRR